MKLGNSPLKFKNPPFGISPIFLKIDIFSPEFELPKIDFPPHLKGGRGNYDVYNSPLGNESVAHMTTMIAG